MPHPLLIFSQSDCLIWIVVINPHTWWQTVQIQISWLLQKPTDLDLHYLQKPTDLDLHCLQRQGISGFSRTTVKLLLEIICIYVSISFNLIYSIPLSFSPDSFSVPLRRSSNPQHKTCLAPNMAGTWPCPPSVSRSLERISPTGSAWRSGNFWSRCTVWMNVFRCPLLIEIFYFTSCHKNIGPDKRGYPHYTFLISPWRHTLWVLIRSASVRHF